MREPSRRLITRRSLLMMSAVSACAAHLSSEVLIVRSAQLPAYADAVDGLQATVASDTIRCTVVDVDPPGTSGPMQAALDRRPAVVVAAGSSALQAVLAGGSASAVVVMMVLAPPPARTREVVTTVTLEVPPALALSRLKQLYPDRNRIAIVRGPSLSSDSAAKLETAARLHGFQMKMFDCPGPRELLHAIAAMQDAFHFAWCFPDSELYQGPAMSAAILAAIRYRVPLIGFSEGVVRAGALVGFYPDYREIGRQTGEAVLARLRGAPVPAVERPRKVITAVNERVMRVLGVSHRTLPPEAVVVR